jgi:hypothetical protein
MDQEKPLRFSGPCPGPSFIASFEAVAGHNNWTAQEKATHFLVIQGQAADEQ